MCCVVCVSNSYRITSEEKRYEERMAMEDPEVTYKNIRRAAEVHRQVRKYARKFIRPGMRMIDIAEGIENGVRALVEEEMVRRFGFKWGVQIGFHAVPSMEYVCVPMKHLSCVFLPRRALIPRARALTAPPSAGTCTSTSSRTISRRRG